MSREDRPMIKVWITRYALTKGVYSVEGEESGNMLVVPGGARSFTQYFHGNDWHKTELAAIEHAVLMSSKRSNSLKKALSKNQEAGHRFVAELEMLRKGQARPLKKLTKKQLAVLQEESKEQQLADEQAIEPWEDLQ